MAAGEAAREVAAPRLTAVFNIQGSEMIFLLLVAIYPFVEGWITGDQREHHMTQRPRNAPRRTASKGL